MQKQAFCSPGTQNGRRVIKVYRELNETSLQDYLRKIEEKKIPFSVQESSTIFITIILNSLGSENLQAQRVKA